MRWGHWLRGRLTLFCQVSVCDGLRSLTLEWVVVLCVWRGRAGGQGGGYAREMVPEEEGQRVLEEGRLSADLRCVALHGVAGKYRLYGVVLEGAIVMIVVRWWRGERGREGDVHTAEHCLRAFSCF